MQARVASVWRWEQLHLCGGQRRTVEGLQLSIIFIILNFFIFSVEIPASQHTLLATAVALTATSWWATSARYKKVFARISSVLKTQIVRRMLDAFCLARWQQFPLSLGKYFVPGDGMPVLPQLCGFKRNCSSLSKDWRLYPCPSNCTGHFSIYVQYFVSVTLTWSWEHLSFKYIPWPLARFHKYDTSYSPGGLLAAMLWAGQCKDLSLQLCQDRWHRLWLCVLRRKWIWAKHLQWLLNFQFSSASSQKENTLRNCINS